MKTFLFNLAMKYYGLDTVILIAGLAGAFVSISRDSKLKWWGKVSALVSGALTANYLTPIVGNWLMFSDVAHLYGVAFFLGYGGLKSVETLLVVFTSKINKEA